MENVYLPSIDMRKFLFILLSGIVSLHCLAQNVGTEQWDIHLPYGSGNSICEADGFIYVGTGAGMYSISQADQSLKRFSTVNGLTDVTVSALGYSTEAECLIIGYSNGNIDLMKGNTIINMNDILNASSITFKKIFNITIEGTKAYLACEFGVAVVDLVKEEIPSYVIFTNTNGFELPVRQIAIADDGTVVAASDGGLFHYSGTGAFQDFGAWVRYPGVYVGTYNSVVNHEGKLYANYSRKLSNDIDNQDTIYTYNGNSWVVWDSIVGRTITSLDAQNGKFSILLAPISGFIGTLMVKNTDGSNFALLEDDFVSGGVYAFTDSKGITWMAHNSLGALRVWNYNERNFFYPDGPFSGGSYRMKHNGKYLWVAGGGMSTGFAPLYRIDGIIRFRETDQKWDYFNLVNTPIMNGASDFIDLTTTDNPDLIYTVSNGTGAFQISENSVTAKYDSSTTEGILTKAPLYGAVLGSSIGYDANGATWMGMSYSSRPLAVRKPNGDWQSFTVPGVGITDAITVVTPLTNGQIWISVRGKGIYVIKHENYIITQVKIINSTTGTGSLPSTYIHCITQDKDGEVWVGTENGFIIFYNPDAILSSSSYNGVIPVVVAADGNNEKLLDGVFVKDIAVDGGNRKWLATYGAGAYLLSADGYTIQKHFLKSNSPLLSDNLLSTTINPDKGNVYFGTDQGIISYRSDATEADDSFSELVYAFPNPVRPENTGPITITGLAQNAELKITDISGQLIYQTKANGGTAIWSGNNFNGQRAHTGVYLVFAANADGSQHEVTRILFIN